MAEKKARRNCKVSIEAAVSLANAVINVVTLYWVRRALSEARNAALTLHEKIDEQTEDLSGF